MLVLMLQNTGPNTSRRNRRSHIEVLRIKFAFINITSVSDIQHRLLMNVRP